MMRSLVVSAAFAALLSLPPVSASPTPDSTAATAIAACNPTPEKRVTFDKLAVGSSPPTGLGETSWNGFTVTNAESSGGLGYNNGVIAASSPNYAELAFPVGSSVAGYWNSSKPPYQWNGIVSFDFACSTIQGHVVPGPCDLSIIVTTVNGGSETLGPFSYAGGQGETGNMTKVTLPYSTSLAGAPQAYYFVVGSGPRYGGLFVDNVVISKTVEC